MTFDIDGRHVAHTDIDHAVKNEPLDQVVAVSQLIDAISSLSDLIDHRAIEEVIKAGIQGTDRTFKFKCQFVKALKAGKYLLASRFCLNVIEDELDEYKEYKYSALRDIFGHTRSAIAFNLSYSGTEKIVSTCIGNILSRAYCTSEYYWPDRSSIYGKSIPHIFNFLRDNPKLPTPKLSILCLTGKLAEFYEIIIHYDFIKTLTVRLFLTIEELAKFSYDDLYKKIKSTIKYQFIFIEPNPEVPPAKEQTEIDSSRKHQPFNMIGFVVKVYGKKILKAMSEIKIKHVWISRVTPEIREWDKYMHCIDISQMRRFKLEMNVFGSAKVKCSVYFTCSSIYRFRPLADCLESLFQDALVTKPNFELLDELCSSKT